jgi:hypothetical protein
MSVKIGLASAITAIVEMALPRGSGDNQLLWVPVTFQLMGWKESQGKKGVHSERSYDVRTSIHLLFHRPHNYTKVFFFEDTQDVQFYPHLIDNKKIEWQLQSDHDSCWSSDGLRCLDKVYQRLKDDLAKKLKVDIDKLEGQINPSEFISFGMFGPKRLQGEVIKHDTSESVTGHSYPNYKITFTKPA